MGFELRNPIITVASNLCDKPDNLKRMEDAGADCVQVVGTLYKNKIEHIGKMITDIEDWMKSKNYNSIDDFRGKLAEKNINDPFVYKRAQYVDLLLESEDIFKKKGLL